MKINKAITFRASSIGDCLMAKYLLENIHDQFREAQCAIVVGSRGEMIKDLFRAYPWLEVIEANRRDLRSLKNLWSKYRQSDLVVTQYAGKPGGKFSLASKLVAKCLSRRGGLVGFADAFWGNRWLFDTLVPIKKDLSIADHERAVLQKNNLVILQPFPKMKFIEDKKILARFNLQADQFLVVHLFAGGKGRGLSPQRKRELLESLVKANLGIKLVVSGSKTDQAEIKEIIQDLPVVSVAKETNLQDMMNLISLCRGVLSLDTGMAHLAAQLGKSLVVLRSCVAPNWWFKEQYGPDASIAVLEHDKSCEKGHIYRDYPACLQEISLEEVVRVIKEKMNHA